MNKADLITAIASKAKLTKKDSEEALNALLESVETALKKGDKVTLVGFGTFDVRKRAARNGINPQTKAEIKIPAKKAPIFKAGKGLKDLVNGVKKEKKAEAKPAVKKDAKKDIKKKK